MVPLADLLPSTWQQGTSLTTNSIPSAELRTQTLMKGSCPFLTAPCTSKALRQATLWAGLFGKRPRRADLAQPLGPRGGGRTCWPPLPGLSHAGPRAEAGASPALSNPLLTFQVLVVQPSCRPPAQGTSCPSLLDGSQKPSFLPTLCEPHVHSQPSHTHTGTHTYHTHKHTHRHHTGTHTTHV